MKNIRSTGGVLPFQTIQQFVFEERIQSCLGISDDQIQPNSLDLRIGSKAFRTQCSFLPSGRTVQELLKDYSLGEYDTGDGFVLECNKTYIIPLCERLRLPANVTARANPKSTVGRLDMLARVITDSGELFDSVPAGYTGGLWLDIIPRSFPVRVYSGDSLVQIRFIEGGNAVVQDEDLRHLIRSNELIRSKNGETLDVDGFDIDDGIYLTVQLSENSGVICYEAARSTPVLDFRSRNQNADEYWHSYDETSLKGGRLILQPDLFYLFRSKERICIPENVCGEVVAYDPKGGELRTHYAGFLDSGFGLDGRGAHLVLEVRNKNMPFLMQDGQRLFRVRFFWNKEPPSVLYGENRGSHYQGQSLRLARQFH